MEGKRWKKWGENDEKNIEQWRYNVEQKWRGNLKKTWREIVEKQMITKERKDVKINYWRKNDEIAKKRDTIKNEKLLNPPGDARLREAQPSFAMLAL